MFVIDGKVHWTASDLTVAVECEYAFLRMLDYRLGLAAQIDDAEDPLMEHIARMGDVHEARLLAEFRASARVAELQHVDSPFTMPKLTASKEATMRAFSGDADVIFQPSFFDGEFFGYADFVERTPNGWVVCDAKLARSAKPKALIQLGAYADQLHGMGLPVASTVSLLLGSGERMDFRTADVMPVFLERRARLRELIDAHLAAEAPIVWGDDRFLACGRCPECTSAAEATHDLIGVAGVAMEQRRRLRETGIQTIGDLASATTKPARMAQATFDKLRAQARLQWAQIQAGEGAPVEFELIPTAPHMLSLLPAPSEGDLFFDFEGDPLFGQGDENQVGLEYLWGVMDATGAYVPMWAHDRAQEREALIAFIELVEAKRAAHPDMHVYHYAPYETTALKRLVLRYQTCEKELDDLLRSEVFVDLYATVRGSIRVSQPSYSIKKLEPLYMGDDLRDDDDGAVADGGASVVAYHEYREWAESDPARAEERLRSLADYNEYDCRSTLRLRDWLLDRAHDAGVRHLIVPRVKHVEGEELADQDPLFLELMAKSGPESPSERTADEQAYALLAAALGYYRRESKQFWWAHFERLGTAVSDWPEARDVFVVESAEVVGDWAVPEGGARNFRRTVRLTGDWTPGSKPNSRVQAVYEMPGDSGAKGPEGCPFGSAAIETRADDPHDERIVYVTESRKRDETFTELPLALVPAPGPNTGNIEQAIIEVCEDALITEGLPEGAPFDLLSRRTPRLKVGVDLPVRDTAIDSVVQALLDMDDSYVAIQGPPGTGKTYTGARVIKALVEKHHWRIGVVAQSHAVVENMLAGIIDAGLDATLVGKAKTERTNPSWTSLNAVPGFLSRHERTGCVIGGTAWDFTNENVIERQSLDLLVVDEAGQFALAPTIGVSVAAKRLLLLGDPQQLPQVSQGTHPEPIDQSALGWLMEGHDTIPPQFGYFLADSFRMHPDLCAKVSTLSYDDRLESAEQASQRRLDGVEPGLQVVHLDHAGNRVESEEEAEEVVAQVRALIGAVWLDPKEKDGPRPLEQTDFLVVAPYNAQVSRIQNALTAAGLADVRVGTVDKFQGQEAPIAIVSMTASSRGDVPRGMGFLLSRNRVNVAVSRAQWLAILIRSESLTAFMPSSANGVLELGGFIGLCQSPAESAPVGQHGAAGGVR